LQTSPWYAIMSLVGKDTKVILSWNSLSWKWAPFSPTAYVCFIALTSLVLLLTAIPQYSNTSVQQYLSTAIPHAIKHYYDTSTVNGMWMTCISIFEASCDKESQCIQKYKSKKSKKQKTEKQQKQKQKTKQLIRQCSILTADK